MTQLVWKLVCNFVPRPWLSGITILLPLLGAGLAPAADTETKPPAATANVAGEPSAEFPPPKDVEVLALPADDAELLDLIDDLKLRRPLGRSEEEIKEHLLRVHWTIVLAALRLQKSEKVSEENRLLAQLAELDSLAILAQLRPEAAQARARARCQELKASKSADLRSGALRCSLVLELSGDLENDDQQVARALEAFQAFVTEKGLGAAHLSRARQAAMMFERAGRYEAALEAFGLLKEGFSHADRELALVSADLAEKAQRRMGVVGKKLELSGTRLDGQPFDVAQYKGKVVLVDFWATWCPPCVAEMPHLHEVYKQYHDKGFEVVGISLDDSRRDVEDFVKERELPWVMLFHDNTEATSQLADKFGISTIPSTLLVSPEGKVLTLKARGEDLDKHLEKLLGPPAKKDPADGQEK